MTEDEMVGWHLRLNGHEFGQTCGDSEGQGSLACCSPWGCKELDMTELTEQQQYVPPLRSLMHTVQTEVQVRIGKMTSEKECYQVYKKKNPFLLDSQLP